MIEDSKIESPIKKFVNKCQFRETVNKKEPNNTYVFIHPYINTYIHTS